MAGACRHGGGGPFAWGWLAAVTLLSGSLPVVDGPGKDGDIAEKFDALKTQLL